MFDMFEMYQLNLVNVMNKESNVKSGWRSANIESAYIKIFNNDYFYEVIYFEHQLLP